MQYTFDFLKLTPIAHKNWVFFWIQGNFFFFKLELEKNRPQFS